MNPQDVTVGLAMLAGLASFLSPCVLALVPAYVGYLSGRSVDASGGVVRNRWVTFCHGVAFVLGFSLVFITLGAAASAVGAFLYDLRGVLAKVGGVVVVIFGLQTMGLIHIPFLDTDTRRQVRPNPSLGYLSSALMGIFFSAGWSPCVGLVLTAVLALAMTAGQIQRGLVLLTAYSAGLAIPFLLAALGIGRVAEWIQRYQRAVRVVSVITGVVLVVVGILLFMGSLSELARFSPIVDLGL